MRKTMRSTEFQRSTQMTKVETTFQELSPSIVHFGINYNMPNLGAQGEKIGDIASKYINTPTQSTHGLSEVEASFDLDRHFTAHKTLTRRNPNRYMQNPTKVFYQTIGSQ